MHYFVRCNAPEDTREKFKLVRRQEGGERVGRETGRERRERKRERIRGEREGGGRVGVRGMTPLLLSFDICCFDMDSRAW